MKKTGMMRVRIFWPNGHTLYYTLNLPSDDETQQCWKRSFTTGAHLPIDCSVIWEDGEMVSVPNEDGSIDGMHGVVFHAELHPDEGFDAEYHVVLDPTLH